MRGHTKTFAAPPVSFLDIRRAPSNAVFSWEYGAGVRASPSRAIDRPSGETLESPCGSWCGSHPHREICPCRQFTLLAGLFAEYAQISLRSPSLLSFSRLNSSFSGERPGLFPLTRRHRVDTSLSGRSRFPLQGPRSWASPILVSGASLFPNHRAPCCQGVSTLRISRDSCNPVCI